MVYILLGEGFEEIEAIAPYDILKRGGVDVRFASVNGKNVTGGHGISIISECAVGDIDINELTMIVVPGGMGGVKSILACDEALSKIKEVYNSGKFVAAICAGPMVLSKAGVIEGKHAVCYPGLEANVKGGIMIKDTKTVRDGNIITGRGPGAAIDFGLELLKALNGDSAAQKIADDMYYERG